MKRIQQLQDDVINQIAAGEVIERPASVVKELVENSIDAGATKIEVEVSQGGRYLRVSDNGSGIEADDITLAFSRHATSKIVSETDLWELQSLGFRGEALASILSISKVSCTTKTKDAENGIKLTNSENGELKTVSIGCAIGTTIEISELFYNVPARLKFLKKPTTEIAAVVEVLQNIAIAHPEVAITCKNQNKIALKTSGSNDLCLCLNEIFSKDLLKHLLLVNAIDEGEKFFINGVVTDPTFTKSNRKSIYIIINGRFIKCPILTKAVERAFEDKMPSGKFPLAVINLILPPGKVDVNVHPTKKEVRYDAANAIFGFVNYAIRKALQEGDFYLQEKKEPQQELIEPVEVEQQKVEPQKPSIDIEEPKSSLIKNIEKAYVVKQKEPVKLEQVKQFQERQPFVSEATSKASIEYYAPLKDDDKPKLEPKEEPTSQQLVINPIVQSKDEPERKNWHIIGQAFNTYIIVQTDNSLQIIDQHIAAERAIYDKLKRQEHNVTGQRLLIIEELDLTLEHKALLEEHATCLENWGYEFEHTKDNKIAITQVPQLLTNKDQKHIFEEIISFLENGDSINTIEDNILKTMACHAAIKAGDFLSNKEMEEIISQWLKSDYPYTCPHGRKICHEIDIKDLSGYFDRQHNCIGSI